MIEQSIPYRVHFLQTHLSTLPKINEERRPFLPTEEKTTKRTSEINTAPKRISGVFHNYITNGLTQLLPTQNEMAVELNISVSALKLHLKAIYGKSFYQVYMDKKMEYAAQLLQKGYRANKVSLMVGYGEKSCIKFNKMFQKHFGITPKKYQLQNQKK